MQSYASPLRLPPNLGHALVDVCLMYYLGYVLGHIVDEGRIWSRDLCAVDSICGAIFDEEGEESVDAVDEENDDDSGDDEEDGKAAAHSGQVESVLAESEAVAVENAERWGSGRNGTESWSERRRWRRRKRSRPEAQGQGG